MPPDNNNLQEQIATLIKDDATTLGLSETDREALEKSNGLQDEELVKIVGRIRATLDRAKQSEEDRPGRLRIIVKQQVEMVLRDRANKTEVGSTAEEKKYFMVSSLFDELKAENSELDSLSYYRKPHARENRKGVWGLISSDPKDRTSSLSQALGRMFERLQMAKEKGLMPGVRGYYIELFSNPSKPIQIHTVTISGMHTNGNIGASLLKTRIKSKPFIQTHPKEVCLSYDEVMAQNQGRKFLLDGKEISEKK